MGLANIEVSVDVSMQLENYREKLRGRLITVNRNNTDNTSINRRKITRKQKWEEKQLYRHFKQQKAKSHTRKPEDGLEREFLLIAAQNNAIRTISKQDGTK